MRTTRRLLAVLPLAALAIAGCGGGGGDESTPATAPVETTETAALTKAELITQGDAICAEVNAAVGSAGSTSTSAGDAVTQVAGLYAGMVERLEALGAPSDEGAGYSEFISSAEALSQAEQNVKLAYEREEGEELASASSEVAVTLAKFQSVSQEFGFEKCAETPSAPTPSGSGTEAAGEESSGGVEGEVEEAAPEEAEAAPEEAPPVEEGAGGGATAGGTEGGGSATGGGSSGGIGPG